MPTFWRILRAAGLIAVMTCMSGAVADAATFTLLWNRNPEAAVTGYKLSWGAVSRTYSTTIDVANDISYVFNGADPTRRYYFAVQAYDKDGLLSAYSTEISWPATPTVSITAPAGGTLVSGSIAVTAIAAAEVGVVGVQFTLDGAMLGAEDTTSPYSVSWNTAGVASGSHTLAAIARDGAGNQTTSAPVIVTVNTGIDTTPPVISAVTPGAITGSGSATLTWATNEASDSQVDFGLTTAYGSTSGLNGALVTAHTVTLTGLTGATPYHVRVRSRDAAGNLALSGDFIVRQTVLPSFDDVALDFGAAGLWVFDNNADYAQLHGLNPGKMATGDLDGNGKADLLVDFPGHGIWVWSNHASWYQLHTADAAVIVTGDLDGDGRADVLVAFPGVGLWAYMNNARWFQLHTLSPTKLATGDLDGNGKAEVITDFAGYGVWVWSNNAAWSQLHASNAASLVTGDLDGNGKAEVLLDFPGAGLWVWANNAVWSQLHTADATVMATGDLDGNGKADAIIGFPGAGVWAWMNNAGFTRLHGSDAAVIMTADIDGNGKAEAIISFPGSGAWALMNNSWWLQLHTQNPEGMTAGNFDGR